jgi:hypothetical protein
MGVRTRSATSSPVKPPSKKPEPQGEQNEPLKLFILPEESSPNARFLLLHHPRDRTLKRFYFCPGKGLYELTKISAPSIDPRSILFAPIEDQGSQGAPDNELEGAKPSGAGFGYVNKAAEFFVATIFDASFLLLPILMPKKAEKSLFQPLDNILEHALDEDKHLKYIFKHGRQLLEDAMMEVCDKVEAGDEKMYRLSEEKLVKYLLAKCERVVAKGLPPSLEDMFVTRVLEAPILGIKREDSSITTVTTTSEELTEAEMDSHDTQSSTASTAPSTVFSEAASVTTVSTVVEDESAAKLPHLQRLRVAFNFIVSSYAPASISARLTTLFESEKTSIDFTSLTSHLAQLAKLRAEVAASRSIGDFSRKRNLEEEEFNETREEKKRKISEEEKRKKAGQSMGVRALKKVDVSGMKKMSSFFTKDPPKAKP